MTVPVLDNRAARSVFLARHGRDGRREGFTEKVDDALRHIADNGPCGSSDVGTDEVKGSGGWWDWHPSKTAMEYLWRSGASVRDPADRVPQGL